MTAINLTPDKSHEPKTKPFLDLYFREGKALFGYEATLNGFLLQLKGRLTYSDFQMVFDKSLENLRKTKGKFLILSLREAHPDGLQVSRELLTLSWMQTALQIGLQKLLIVVSPEIFALEERLDFDQRPIGAHDTVAYFSKEHRAWEHLFEWKRLAPPI